MNNSEINKSVSNAATGFSWPPSPALSTSLLAVSPSFSAYLLLTVFLHFSVCSSLTLLLSPSQSWALSDSDL